jgi:RNA polymerase sigma-70 factor (ECF subfamily)
MRSLRDPDAWEAWLYRLTVWACYRLARIERRRAVNELHVLPDTDVPHQDDMTGIVVDRDRLERHLDALPIEQRAMVVLRYFLDVPLADAAAILDIPLGTAKSRLYRGLETMRSRMSPELEPLTFAPQERTA